MPEDGQSASSPQTKNGALTQSAPAPSPAESEKSQPGFLSGLMKAIGLKDNESNLKDALQEVLEDHAAEVTAMAPEERRMLSNVMELGDLDVEDIMVPLSDVEAVEWNTGLKALREMVIESGHTRYPVYEDTLDTIKGFIHVKDLLPVLGSDKEGFHISQIMREVVFVPEAMKLSDLLLKMRLSGIHLAIVVDEYGGTSGLVTLEDLFEEIVGEIQDEHDDPEEGLALKWSGKSTVIVDAKTRIDELEEALKIDFQPEDEEDDYDTLGGLIFSQLGRVPHKGEKTKHPSGVVMEVLDADDRRIKTVRLTKVKGDSVAA